MAQPPPSLGTHPDGRRRGLQQSHPTRLRDGRAKRHGLTALLDEFPQLGRVDFIEKSLAVCAGYGVRAALVCQDEDQIRGIYGSHQSITANCGTICVIPGFSHGSLDTVTRWGGERVQVTTSKQRQPGALRAPSIGETETRVAVLNPRELIRRGRHEVLVFTAGCAPTWLTKVRYDKERELAGLFDGRERAAADQDDEAPVPAAPTTAAALEELLR